MTLELEWPEILLRLTLTMFAGVVLGIDRSERGRFAGLRTTVLVCLAASVSMIQVNLLLPLRGKSPDSFNVLDLMRLPLGILTGMGFIGAGAILRKGDRIQGVTTAASLWLATVIGLCLGGGQIGLGLAALTLGFLVLWGLRWVELRLKEDRRATLILRIRGEVPTETEIRDAIVAAGFSVETWDLAYRRIADHPCVTIRGGLRWHGRRNATEPPSFLLRYSRDPAVLGVRWKA